jgi:hypothetical protein
MAASSNNGMAAVLTALLLLAVSMSCLALLAMRLRVVR